MENPSTFSYNYSAKENNEVQEIRKKYLPASESKLDELKRLDSKVQNAGVTAALCVGIINALLFGLGMCLAMQVIGSGVPMIALGVVLGIIGMGGMLIAYPIYRRKYNREKEQYAPRILALTEELSSGKN